MVSRLNMSEIRQDMRILSENVFLNRNYIQKYNKSVVGDIVNIRKEVIGQAKSKVQGQSQAQALTGLSAQDTEKLQKSLLLQKPKKGARRDSCIHAFKLPESVPQDVIKALARFTKNAQKITESLMPNTVNEVFMDNTRIIAKNKKQDIKTVERASKKLSLSNQAKKDEAFSNTPLEYDLAHCTIANDADYFAEEGIEKLKINQEREDILHEFKQPFHASDDVVDTLASIQGQKSAKLNAGEKYDMTKFMN